MMKLMVEEVDEYTPESINRQLASGKTREELAEQYGHKSYKAVDMFMRRNGYCWNSNKEVYELAGVFRNCRYRDDEKVWL